MHLSFVFIADTGMATGDGKFSVIGGGLGTLSAPSFPALHPVLALVARVLFDSDEAGKTYPFQIELIGPSGEPIAPVATGPVAVPIRSEVAPEDIGLEELPLSVGIVVNFPGITFPTPGRYIFQISGGGEVLGSAPLFVTQSISPSTSSDVDSHDR